MGALFQIEALPFAGLDEGGPVEGMSAGRIAERGQLGLVQGVAASQTVFEAGVVSGHDLPRDAVTDGPQAHHQGFGACQEQARRCPYTPSPFFTSPTPISLRG